MYIQACNSDIHGLDLVVGIGEITLKGQCKTPKQTKTQDSNNRSVTKQIFFLTISHKSRCECVRDVDQGVLGDKHP